MASQSFDESAAQFPPPRVEEPANLRREIVAELADHLTCARRREQMAGGEQTEEAVRRRVLNRFGDPAAIARKLWLDWMWEKIMTQRILVGTCVLMAVVSCVALGLAWASLNRQQEMMGVWQTTSETQMRDQQKLFERLLAQSEKALAEGGAIILPSVEWNPIELRFVRGKKDGPPMAGIEANLSIQTEGSGIPPMRGVSDERGIVRFDRVHYGTYSLRVKTPAGEYDDITLTQQPGQGLSKTIPCPESPPKPANVTARIDWPKDLATTPLWFVFGQSAAYRTVGDNSWRGGSLLPDSERYFEALLIEPNGAVYGTASVKPGILSIPIDGSQGRSTRGRGFRRANYVQTPYPIAEWSAYVDRVKDFPNGMVWPDGSYEIRNLSVLVPASPISTIEEMRRQKPDEIDRQPSSRTIGQEKHFYSLSLNSADWPQRIEPGDNDKPDTLWLTPTDEAVAKVREALVEIEKFHAAAEKAEQDAEQGRAEQRRAAEEQARKRFDEREKAAAESRATKSQSPASDKSEPPSPEKSSDAKEPPAAAEEPAGSSDPAAGNAEQQGAASSTDPETPPKADDEKKPVAAPNVKHLFPAGGQRGTTTEITAAGDIASWPVETWTSHASVKVACGEDKGKLNVTIEPDARPGVCLVRLFNAAGASRPLPLVIGNLPEAVEKSTNDSPSQAETLPASIVTVNGRLEKRDDVDVYAVELAAGQTLVASVVANEKLASPMDAVLQVAAADGVVLAQNDDWHGIDPQVVFTAPAAGKYLVRIFAFPAQPDSRIGLAGGDDYVYRLTITTGPFVDFPFPLAVRQQTATDVELAGWNLDDSIKRQSVTAETDPFVIDDGQLAGELVLPVVPHACPTETEPNDAAQSQALAMPALVSGRLQSPDDKDVFRFSAKRGESVVFALDGRELGSPLDAVLEVTDASGKSLGRADDSNKRRDPELTWKAPQDGDYRLVVSDLHGRGGERFFYRLHAALATPDFRLKLPEHTLAAAVGKPLAIALEVERRHGFDQEIAIRVEGLPESIVAEPVASAASGDTAKKVTLKLTGNEPFSGPCRIVGAAKSKTAESGDQTVDKTATKLERTAAIALAGEAEYRDLWITFLPEKAKKSEQAESAGTPEAK